MVVTLQRALQALLNVDILNLQLFKLGGDLLVQTLRIGHAMFVAILIDEAQLFAARIVIKRDGGVVFYGALEVVGGDVFTENFFGDFVILEQWRPGEADETGTGHGVAHVQRERAVLGTVRFVSDDDNVIPFRVRAFRIYFLVEFLDQREHESLVLA
ncbi:hypothetical protein D3C79_756210 [compost metagenome]